MGTEAETELVVRNVYEIDGVMMGMNLVMDMDTNMNMGREEVLDAWPKEVCTAFV